jgi:hypothetical protein
VLIDGSDEFHAVQREKDFHRGVSDSLVAVHKRMVQGQGVAEGRALPGEGRMQVGPAERGARANADSSAPRSRMPVAPPD